jgi:protein-disulfide isomerase
MSDDYQNLTKKERRELRKQDRMSESSTMKRKNTARKFGIWGSVFLGLGLLIFGLAQLGSGVPSATEGDLAVAVSNDDWQKGDLESEVILVEYGDFQCPACGSYYPLVEQLVKDHGANFRFVYRHFPLKSIHPNAEPAARASEAAGLQGKFWEMYEKLFANQNSWSNLVRSAADDRFLQYAREIGLDEEKYKADFESDAVKDKISSQLDGGVASNVSSTPTFYINGKKITNPQSYDEFVQIISRAVAPAAEQSGTFEPTATP